jgi:hypothetical protein
MKKTIMLAQLMDKGGLLKNAFPAGFGSGKNLSSDGWRHGEMLA